MPTLPLQLFVFLGLSALVCCGSLDLDESNPNPSKTPGISKNFLLQNSSDRDFPKIPVFVITCDRLTDLQTAIQSYKQASLGAVEIVIHDNHSTYPPMVRYLEKLEQEGVSVYYHDDDVSREAQLNGVAQTIDSWYKKHDAPYYVVTDPDIELTQGDGSVLQLYAHLLDWHPEVDVVGPMLRVDDLPNFYPMKQQVIASHLAHFRSLSSFSMIWNGRDVRVQRGSLDTTFGMYRKNFRFHRLNNSLQLYEPFDARHLDWYLDPNSLSDDQIYYIRHATGVSHWGGTWMRDYVRN
jgi:hypothetical protein